MRNYLSLRLLNRIAKVPRCVDLIWKLQQKLKVNQTQSTIELLLEWGYILLHAYSLGTHSDAYQLSIIINEVLKLGERQRTFPSPFSLFIPNCSSFSLFLKVFFTKLCLWRYPIFLIGFGCGMYEFKSFATRNLFLVLFCFCDSWHTREACPLILSSIAENWLLVV